MIAILSFAVIFMISFKKVYLANILLYPAILRNFSFQLFDLRRLIVFLIFEIIVIISTINFWLQFGIFNSRNLVQFLFTSQYLLLTLSIKDLKYQDIEKWLKIAGYVLCFYMIWVLFITGTYKFLGPKFLTVHNRMWGARYITQWPNGIVLSFIFVFWLSVRHEAIDWSLAILSSASAILTTSRVGLLGVLLIAGYRIAVGTKGRSNKFKIITLVFSFLIGSIALIIVLSIPEIRHRLFYYIDRGALWKETLRGISNRPWLGYGGNSLDVYSKLFEHDPSIDWLMTHTHNTLFEIAFRYGILGLLLFVYILSLCFKHIKVSQNKAMFLILLFLSLFQIYIRDFIFIFFLLFLINEKEEFTDEAD